MSTRAGSRGGFRRGSSSRRGSSRTFVHSFNEPSAANNGDFNLKTTGQGLGEFPGENALAFLVDPDRAQRQSNKSIAPKVSRRPPRSVNENTRDENEPKEHAHKQHGEERLFLRLKRNLEETAPVSYSFIRENPNKGTEDYRHSKPEIAGKNGQRSKRRRTSWAPDAPEPDSPRRSRRSTRPSVYEYQATRSLDADEPGTSSPADLPPSAEPSPPAGVSKAERMTKSTKGTRGSALKDSQVLANGDLKIEPKRKDLVNNDYCNSCGGTGELLCCETCVRSFHFSCVEPPVMSVEEIPEDEWSCRHCKPRLLEAEEKEEISRTFFGPLVVALESHNAVAFQVPTNIREMFAHIKTTKFGEFEEEFMKTDSVTPGPRIQDRNGSTLLCYKCKNSALRGKEMAVCSKCQEPWHIDCVNPPLESTPYGYWVCPLHAGATVELPLRVKKPVLTTVALQRQVANNGDIEVLDDEKDDDNAERAKIPISSTDYNDRVDAGSFSDEEVAKNVTFPAQTRMTPEGSLVAKSSRLRPRGYEPDRVVYKLPARTIKLDFLDAVHKSRHEPLKETPTSDFLLGLDCLAAVPENDSAAVRNLMQLKLQGPAVDTAQAKQNLSTLLDAALDDENEIGQIAAIRSLMKSTGKQRLLEMLSVAE